jgi:hypothetical protein
MLCAELEALDGRLLDIGSVAATALGTASGLSRGLVIAYRDAGMPPPDALDAAELARVAEDRKLRIEASGFRLIQGGASGCARPARGRARHRGDGACHAVTSHAAGGAPVA